MAAQSFARALLAAGFFALAPFSAGAEVPADYEAVCPIGGERFTASGYAAYSTYGARLDGKPFGSTQFPLRLAVCPSNGFVIYKDGDAFTAAEIAALTAYMATPEYHAITPGQSTYYRAAHLAAAAGAPLEEQAWLMLQASWQVDSAPETHARYQQEFLALADAALASGDRTDAGWWMLQARAANAERQLARFEAAVLRLDALPREALEHVRIERDAARWREGYLALIERIAFLAHGENPALEEPRR